MLNRECSMVSAIILSIGIAIAGVGAGAAIYFTKVANRTMTVKGIAEKNVNSDLGIWEINYREVGNDLITINNQLQHDQELVISFLKQHGFSADEITPSQLKIEDRFANIYNTTSTENKLDQRYVVTSGLRIRSVKVAKIQEASQASSALLQQGVSLTFDGGTVSPNPSYYYTTLDGIRPQMMATATSSARAVANQFAKDAGIHLAGIQRASQGVFQVMGRDTSTMNSDWSSNQSALGSIEKKVRLVTTIDYRLK